MIPDPPLLFAGWLDKLWSDQKAVRQCKLSLYGKVPWFHAPAIKIPIGPGTEFGIADCSICKRGLGAPMTISIIDDDQFAREATGDLVQSLGYEVATFESAERFLESGRIAETSCLITDLEMPVSGLNMTAARLSLGAISESNSSHLPPSEASKSAKRVMFPLGRSSRSTMPLATGSLTFTNTIGIVCV